MADIPITINLPITSAYDRWRTYDPAEDETDDICPDCEEAGREGWVTGDGRWEWWCTNEECNYGGDCFPDPD